MHLRAITCAGVLIALHSTPCSAQAFVQLADMGSNIGPRLTRARSVSLIGRRLFAEVGTFASFVQGQTAYEFVTDPTWQRVMFGEYGIYVNAYTNGAGVDRLVMPLGLDVTAKKTVLVADFGLSAVVIARFDAGPRTLTTLAVVRHESFADGPIDIAWDGQTDPLNREYFYVLTGTGKISYWQWNGTTATQLWAYAAPAGGGDGQLLRPSGICVGRSLGTSGGTVFTTDLMVADAGNRRLARFVRTSNGVSWNYSIVLPSTGVPADCATDHFGNIYVTDPVNSKLVKYNPWLWYLTSYGSYGRGANNLNTLSHPRGLHHPLGIRTNSSGQPVVYSEGRLITAEDWGDSSGSVQHYLGMWGTIETPVVDDPYASVGFTAMDNAYVSADVWGTSQNAVVRSLVSSGSLFPAGMFGLYWDGRLANGNPAPDGYYQFRVSLSSTYSCPSGATWCWKFLLSASFWHRYCVEGGGGGDTIYVRGDSPAELREGPIGDIDRSPPARRRADTGGHTGPMNLPVGPPTCGPSITTLDMFTGHGIPTVFGVRQLPTAPARLAEGLTPLGSVPELGPSLSIAGTALNAPASSQMTLRQQVRQRGVTAIQVNLSEPSGVQVEVFDLGGARVWHLDAGSQLPGMYVLKWGGTRDNGGRAPPGVYQAIVSAQGRRTITRLVLVAESGN